MKKRLLVVVTLVLVAVLVLTLVACGGNTEQNTDNSTSTPPSGQTPDSGDGDNEGEITLPENPGGEIGEPEDPKDPDDGGEVTDPDDGNEGEDPETPEQPAFVVDTVEKLLEYRSATLYNTLNDCFMDGVLYKCTLSHDFTYDDTIDVNWYIAESTETDLLICGVTFFIQRGNSFHFYNAQVTFAEPVPVTCFAEGNIPQEMISAVTYRYSYACSAIADQVENYRPLAEAIITALGETFSPEDTILMAMNNASTDPQWSWVRSCVVKQITETGVHEYTITINARNTSGENLINQLILNVQAGEYKNNKVEKNVVTFETGVTADSVDKALPDATA